MKTLANKTAEMINEYRNNSTIMGFVTKEALERTARDTREKTGSGTTAKAVDLLRITNKKVSERVDHYINAGLLGCAMAAQQMHNS